jgi:hypothetical protein
MLEASFHLLNLVYPDSSCCQDKVNRAAGRRAVGSVFCSPFIKCTVTSKLRFHFRDSYVISFYRDQTTCVHLPGLAKNSPTLTQTAPNYTTEPLSKMRGTSDNSATLTANNKVYRDKTTFRRLSICTATRKMPAESSCLRTYKKLALAPCLFRILVLSETNYSHL